MAGRLDEALARAAQPVRAILEKALVGGEVSEAEGLRLFSAEGADLTALLAAASAARERKKGDTVTFVITRNINFTNICYTGCGFCGFAKRKDDPEAEFLPLEEIAARAREAWGRGATEVCIQGGLHPNISGWHYRDILTAIKHETPQMHIHAYSPFEIKYGAGLLGMAPADFLSMLKDHGLGTIPGTAAEILDVEIRGQLTKNKLTAEEWVDIVKTAHRLGIRSTATIMYGHVDAPRHWAAHIRLIRDIQKETGGFTEFVPLGFIHWDAPIYLQGRARQGPSRDDNLRMHAVSRLMLNGWIDNIQVSWVKLGPRMAQYIIQHGGANDFGGTLMNESISRSAGAPYGQEVTPMEMVRMIREIARTPARRNTVYEIQETYLDHDPPDYETLVPRAKEQVI